MRIATLGFFFALVSSLVASDRTASAGPRTPRASDDPVEVHRSAARALLALGDIDGAWLELSAAFHQSCDARLVAAEAAAEMAAAPRHTGPYPKMGDSLLPVPTLLTLRRNPANSVNALEPDALVPFYSVFRSLNDGEDDLVSFDDVFRRSRARASKPAR